MRFCSLLLSYFLRYALMVESLVEVQCVNLPPIALSSNLIIIELDQPAQVASGIGSSELVEETPCLNPASAVFASGCGSQSSLCN